MSFYKLKQGRTVPSPAPPCRLPPWGALGRHLARLELGQALETGHRSSPMQLKMIIAFELGQQLSELLRVVPSRAHVTNCDQVYLLLLLFLLLGVRERKWSFCLAKRSFVCSFVRSMGDQWSCLMANPFRQQFSYILAIFTRCPSNQLNDHSERVVVLLLSIALFERSIDVSFSV